jgi:hypothetical protein
MKYSGVPENDYFITIFGINYFIWSFLVLLSAKHQGGKVSRLKTI